MAISKIIDFINNVKAGTYFPNLFAICQISFSEHGIQIQGAYVLCNQNQYVKVGFFCEPSQFSHENLLLMYFTLQCQ